MECWEHVIVYWRIFTVTSFGFMMTVYVIHSNCLCRLFVYKYVLWAAVVYYIYISSALMRFMTVVCVDLEEQRCRRHGQLEPHPVRPTGETGPLCRDQVCAVRWRQQAGDGRVHE